MAVLPVTSAPGLCGQCDNGDLVPWPIILRSHINKRVQVQYCTVRDKPVVWLMDVKRAAKSRELAVPNIRNHCERDQRADEQCDLGSEFIAAHTHSSAVKRRAWPPKRA